jgi:hypothetical protein
MKAPPQELKQPGHEADHSYPSIAELKILWCLNSTHRHLQSDNFTLHKRNKSLYEDTNLPAIFNNNDVRKSNIIQAYLFKQIMTQCTKYCNIWK